MTRQGHKPPWCPDSICDVVRHWAILHEGCGNSELSAERPGPNFLSRSKSGLREVTELRKPHGKPRVVGGEPLRMHTAGFRNVVSCLACS